MHDRSSSLLPFDIAHGFLFFRKGWLPGRLLSLCRFFYLVGFRLLCARK